MLAKKQIGGISTGAEEKLLTEIAANNDLFSLYITELQDLLNKADMDSSEERSIYYHDVILPKMEELRTAADRLEVLCAAKYWPFPTYSQLLFY